MPKRLLRDWTDSETIDTLSPQAEVFFVRLIMKADDFGRFSANPKLLKSSCFPLRDSARDTDISRWLAECEKAGVIAVHQTGLKPVLEIKNFGQRIKTGMVSKYPLPADALKKPPDCGQSRDVPGKAGQSRANSALGGGEGGGGDEGGVGGGVEGDSLAPACAAASEAEPKPPARPAPKPPRDGTGSGGSVAAKGGSQPKTDAPSPSQGKPRKSHATGVSGPPSKPRGRDALFDALAAVDGSDPAQLTKPAASAVGVALAAIGKVCPELTPGEIARRAAHYRAHFRDAMLTPSALAKWWARCERPPGGGGGGRPQARGPDAWIPENLRHEYE
jgi:hypothetical protein